ncbi:carboxypeptidase-like regulatory domain-containing protein [Niabella ginsenosidivorans]|uniref:carboxypeptidase-like regulatory domain-containing protein n=1 Tax=Niabella ginsenosidivorans TaxID=1176587 RepID=UPI001FE0D9A0|nr:carboxypeptidase-like regulatory domain-containing protein [Niabella ginsenosidivorans]
MKLLITTALFMALQNAAQAQVISGTVKEGTRPLEKASVSLLKAKDSSVVKLNATDANGIYKFDHITPGSYLIMATNVGYASSYSAVFDYAGGDLKVNDLLMEKASTQLAGVVVTAKKPLVEVKPGKMVVNVEGTINATGNDGMELLRKSPGY